jgi:hypothetical protein
VIHVLSHFRTFTEIKRSYQDSLVERLRVILTACIGTLACCVVFRVLYSASGVSGLDSVAAIAEWAFLGINFFWNHTVQQEFIGPQDTRLYVGRRIALGSSVNCSECFRPFSRSRPRETCADCRDECCPECGRDVHMSEMGSLVDVMCFFCGKCHQLLQAEVNAARSRGLSRNSNALGRGSNAPSPALSARSTSPRKDPAVVEVCRMFQRGECKYGSACKYIHVEPQTRSRGNTENRKRGSSQPPKPARLAVSSVPSESVGIPMSQVPRRSGAGVSSDSEGGMMMDSSGKLSVLDMSDGMEKRRRRRGKRGQRKKKTNADTSDTDGTAADMEDDSDEPESDTL